MKFTIELTKDEVNGIKEYLKSLGDIENPTKQDVRNELQQIVNTHLQSDAEAVRQFINY